MELKDAYGQYSAFLEAKAIGKGNMSISAELVVEMVENLKLQKREIRYLTDLLGGVEAKVETPESEWDGTNYPPVGTKCEYRLGDGPWFYCEVKYVLNGLDDDEYIAIIWCPHLEQDQVVNVEDVDIEFRPIKTESEEEREELEDLIKTSYAINGIEGVADAIQSLYRVGE